MRPCLSCAYLNEGKCTHTLTQKGGTLVLALLALELGAQLRHVAELSPAQLLEIVTLPDAREMGLFDFPEHYAPHVVLMCKGYERRAR